MTLASSGKPPTCFFSLFLSFSEGHKPIKASTREGENAARIEMIG